jgi:hypothetical protein
VKIEMEIVVEGLNIWSYGEMLLNGVLNIKSILLKIVAWLVKECAVMIAGLVCVILGCFVEINWLVVINLVRYGPFQFHFEFQVTVFLMNLLLISLFFL